MYRNICSFKLIQYNGDVIVECIVCKTFDTILLRIGADLKFFVVVEGKVVIVPAKGQWTQKQQSARNIMRVFHLEVKKPIATP